MRAFGEVIIGLTRDFGGAVGRKGAGGGGGAGREGFGVEFGGGVVAD